jgi:zinc transporter ZupT
MEQQRRHLLWLGSPFAIGLTAFLCICFGVILTAFVVTSPDGQLLAVGMVGGVEMELSFWRCLPQRQVGLFRLPEGGDKR